MTRRALSIATGVTEKTIQRLENRETQPNAETARALADFFKVSLDELQERQVESRVVRDDDPIDDPVLQEFLATEAGQRCTPDEVGMLAMIPRRLGKAKSPDVYSALLYTLRSGFTPEQIAEAEARRRKLEERALAEGRTIVKD